MSSYLPAPETFAAASGAARATPMLFCHGDEDETVPLEAGEEAARRARALGVESVEFRRFEGMAHGAQLDELEAVAAFLKRELA
jgi:predicted esterase